MWMYALHTYVNHVCAPWSVSLSSSWLPFQIVFNSILRLGYIGFFFRVCAQTLTYLHSRLVVCLYKNEVVIAITLCEVQYIETKYTPKKCAITSWPLFQCWYGHYLVSVFNFFLFCFVFHAKLLLSNVLSQPFDSRIPIECTRGKNMRPFFSKAFILICSKWIWY